MKTKFLILFLLANLMISAQSKFSVGLSFNQQIVKDDVSENLNLPEGFLSYNFTSDIALSLSGSSINMKNDSSNTEYSVNKIAIQAWYDFGKNDKRKFQSIFGFSYLMFDEDLGLEEDNGLGLDFGFQFLFGKPASRFNYGIKLVSTFTDFAPGGILNGGFIVLYRL